MYEIRFKIRCYNHFQSANRNIKIFENNYFNDKTM